MRVVSAGAMQPILILPASKHAPPVLHALCACTVQTELAQGVVRNLDSSVLVCDIVDDTHSPRAWDLVLGGAGDFNFYHQIAFFFEWSHNLPHSVICSLTDTHCRLYCCIYYGV